MSETGMFLGKPSLLISGGPLVSLLCFGLSLSLPPPVGAGCRWVCESVGKAQLFFDHSMESVYLPLTCHPSPGLTTVAFRSSEVRRLLLDLDTYGGTDPLSVCSFS